MVEEFALNFDGSKAKVGTIEIQVDEAIVAAEIEIPRTSEKWFKKTITKDIEFKSYGDFKSTIKGWDIFVLTTKETMIIYKPYLV